MNRRQAVGCFAIRQATRIGVAAAWLAVCSASALGGDYGRLHAAWREGQLQTVERALKGMAESGDARAQLLLGYLSRTGGLGQVNYAAARRWYRRAADQGVPEAQYELGLMHELGYGTPVDAAEAEFWYGRAIDHGYCPGELDIEAYWHAATPLTPIAD